MGGAAIGMAEVFWAALGFLGLAWAWRTMVWVWWLPRKLEQALRKQGLSGGAYRLLHGDLKENLQLLEEARARPMPLYSHDICPRIAPFIHKTIKQHGKVSITWLGPSPRMILMDPELVQQLLSKKFGHFRKLLGTPVLRLILMGLINIEGEAWVKHRRILNAAFNLEKLKSISLAFCGGCKELVDRWEKRISLEGPIELDVWPEFQSLTGDVISRTAFGSSYEEGKRIFQLQEEQAHLVQHGFHNVYVPGYRFLPTRNNIRRKQIDMELRRILSGMIESRKEAIRRGESNKDDLMGLLIESNLEDDPHGKGNTKKGCLTDQEVIDECKVFYFAGQETTSSLLMWTMVLLSMYPSWQVRAREEVLQVFGESMPNMDGLSRLKIVTMILYEVMRLYPPGIFLNRRAYKPVKLGGVTYPAGVLFLVPLVFIHHAPEYWGEDAGEFKPERFAQGVAKASKVPGAFFPFGVGPRICIGQNFALIEAKMAMSMILQRFSFELSPSYIHAPYTVITLQAQHGAPIKLHKL